MSSILSDIFQTMYGRAIIIAPDLLQKLWHFVNLQFNPFVYTLPSCLQWQEYLILNESPYAYISMGNGSDLQLFMFYYKST